MTTTETTVKPYRVKNNTLCWADYEQLLIAQYVSGGLSKETAKRFSCGEINAIKSGNHWTHGKPTPIDPRGVILQALSEDEREQFTERAGILEYEAGMSRADVEAQVIATIISRKYPASVRAPEKPRNVYKGSAVCCPETIQPNRRS